MVKAIIFDCFGVLVTENWFRFKDEFFADNPEKAARAAELMDQANAGFISHDDFKSELSVMAQIDAGEVQSYLEGNSPNEPLISYISAELKPKYLLGMLSNASGNWLKSMLNPEQLALFDAIDLSYESGVSKPNELAYTNLAEKLGVTPEECLFIDDQERHCTGARNCGMTAIEYKDFNSFKNFIQKYIT